jgi:tRNA nucleotidyltransferase (CCA-adding enzyme)
MEIYLVGGAVRDAAMGLPVRDRDWVVVGATPQEMLDQGYLPVGRDFPVFLHPNTKEEYALARTERKTGPGYRGFAVHAAPEVTLEEDLARRDLTVNAMALPAERVAADPDAPLDTLLIDPFGGRRDIAAKVLRHITPAFREDPVRILRVARFAARFSGYRIADETSALLRAMVEEGQADHLVAERVWQELARGLMEDQPQRMFAVLRDCAALGRVLPEIDRMWGVPQSPQHHPEVDTGVHVMMVLQQAAREQAGLAVRFACLTHDLGKADTPADVLPRHIGHEQRSVARLRSLCQRLRIPTECSELAEVVAREHGNIHRSDLLGAEATVRLLERCDAFRKPERFGQVLQACRCDARGRLGFTDTDYPPALRLTRALELAQHVDSKSIAAQALEQGLVGPEIATNIRRQRIAAVATICGHDTSDLRPI